MSRSAVPTNLPSSRDLPSPVPFSRSVGPENRRKFRGRTAGGSAGVPVTRHVREPGLWIIGFNINGRKLGVTDARRVIVLCENLAKLYVIRGGIADLRFRCVHVCPGTVRGRERGRMRVAIRVMMVWWRALPVPLRLSELASYVDLMDVWFYYARRWKASSKVLLRGSLVLIRS